MSRRASSRPVRDPLWPDATSKDLLSQKGHPVRFTKMHGIGNDYVYVNGFEQTVDDPGAMAVRISDRHFGVGGDGLILLLPPDDEGRREQAHVRMRMFNADGSEAEMCGNGIRCVCKLAYDRGICREHPMRVQTGSGVLSLAYETGDHGQVRRVKVNMGRPVLEPSRIPVRLPDAKGPLDQIVDVVSQKLLDLPYGDADLKQAGVDWRMTCVSMGNPHVVFFCKNVQSVPLEQIGPVIEHAAIFPKRINVHFVQNHGRDEVTMRTWERGSGVTLACGTGACAVCVAGVLTDRTQRRLVAHLPGGDLSLEWHDEDDHIDMTGPAAEVFTGVWPNGQD